jgi:hypothetical protein
MTDYKRRDASGQHANFGIGRRYLRMAMSLMRTSQIYLPPWLRKADATLEERAGYYLMIWPKLTRQWTTPTSGAASGYLQANLVMLPALFRRRSW